MRPLRVLIVEDSDDDCLLVREELKKAGFDPVVERCESAPEMRRLLAEAPWDLVLSDYLMPAFDGLSALKVLQASNQSEVPFIIVSGSIGEVLAVEALKAGASNYVMKENLHKLGPVVDRELKDAQVRRERADAIAALEHAVKARDEFLSIASHELKTPLTSLNLQVQSLLKTVRSSASGANPSLRSKVESVARSSLRLTELIDRLLDITRVSSGYLVLSREELDLASLTHDVVNRLQATFEDAGSALSLRAPASVVGCWDRERLGSVLSNLLTNAAKFGEGKPVDIEVTDLGDRARVRVIDRGMGISPADQERIFGRFERAVPERHHGGFGVGLWLSQRVVQAHGGSLEVDSAPGAGAIFTVTLPKKLDE